MNNDLSFKAKQQCIQSSKCLSTTTCKPVFENNTLNPSPTAINNSNIDTVSSSPSTTPSSSTANATAAFQDLLGLNTDNSNIDDSNSDLKNTFYQRKLPSSLVQFSSSQGKAFFRSAMESNHAEGFFPLTGNFTTQSEPAYCGPSSLAMVLNALEVDPKRRWKQNWRWYSDELLDCCASTDQMKKNGITFDEFACLAKCHSEVVAKRAPTFSFEEFRQDVIDVTARSDRFLVVSFSRKTLGQTGDGHFSPIGAYNPDNDTVLVLDTARYKYPSYWCPIDTLYNSMAPLDSETGRPRGYFLVSYNAEHPPVHLCNLEKGSSKSTNEQQNPTIPTTATSSSQQQPAVATIPVTPTPLNWSTIAQSFCKRIPENMWLEKPRSLEHAIQVVLRNVPPEFTRILANQSMASSKAYMAQQQQPSEEDGAKNYIRHLLQDTTQSPLYPIVFKTLYSTDQQSSSPTTTTSSLEQHQQQVDQQAAFATLFILGSPSMLFTSLPRDLQDVLSGYRQQDFMTDVVKREVARISQEVKELTKSFCTCGPSSGWPTPEHPYCG